MEPGRRLLLALASLTAAACTSQQPASPVTTGALHVVIVAPTGVVTSVTVTGPNGYRHAVTSSQTLVHLPAGSYTILADSVVARDSIIGTDVDTAGVTGSPAIVRVGDTITMTVSYAVKRPTGGLWVANYATDSLFEYGTSQLGGSGTPAPATVLGPVGGPSVMALDPSGDLWVAAYDSAKIIMYTRAQRLTGGTVTPAVVLSGSGISSPNGLAFDANGDLWVTNQSPVSVVEYTPGQLTSTGNPAPTVTLTGAALVSPEGIAFDQGGNAWIANVGSSTIVKYAAAQTRDERESGTGGRSSGERLVPIEPGRARVRRKR